jgi:Fic family protein
MVSDSPHLFSSALHCRGAFMAPKSAPPKKPSVPPPAPTKPLSLEERQIALEQRIVRAGPAFAAKYRTRLDMSWIFHDSALEGVVYTENELATALDPNGTAQALEAGIQPVCEEIRRHRKAIEFIREQAVSDPKGEITVDFIKQLYLMLHPEEGDVKTVRYRKDIPQHRLYFHEYVAPDKIIPRVKAVADWLNDAENRKSKGVMRHATRAHYDLLRVFPFTHDSGKVARLLLNLLLLRGGYPPAIIHMSERQRYYEALKSLAASMNGIVADAIDNNLKSNEKLLDQYESRRIG